MHGIRNVSIAFCLFCSAFGTIIAKSEYTVKISSAGEAIVGSRINFTATLYEKGKIANADDYKFVWRDSTYPEHSYEDETKAPHSNFSVVYSNTSKPGVYVMKLHVQRLFILWYDITSNSQRFKLSDSLVGKLQLLQNDLDRVEDFISIKEPVVHKIQMNKSDEDYINQNAQYIQTFWFQNCTYLGMSDDLSYKALYTKPEEYYEIEALVVVSFEKLPEPTTSTTTTTTTTTSTTTTTTTTTTPKPTTTTTPATTTSSTTTTSTTTPKPNAKKTKRDVPETAMANAALLGFNLTAVLQQQKLDDSKNATKTSINATAALINPQLVLGGVKRLSYLTQHILPPVGAQPNFNCVNKSVIAKDPKKVYGYFKRKIITKEPISDFTTEGNTWVKQGDMLRLVIKCKGSASLSYCYKVFEDPYNVTGKETCDGNYYPLESCQFIFTRYFGESKTILFFIKNEISEPLNPVTIKVYEVKKQSQLSVVVVPLSFSLVAVIMVVFLVYYVQTRNRFMVEVADFNFGETQSVDMEYKTFSQRLIESIGEVMPSFRRFSRSSGEDLIEPEPSVSGQGNETSDIRYNSIN